MNGGATSTWAREGSLLDSSPWDVISLASSPRWPHARPREASGPTRLSRPATNQRVGCREYQAVMTGLQCKSVAEQPLFTQDRNNRQGDYAPSRGTDLGGREREAHKKAPIAIGARGAPHVAQVPSKPKQVGSRPGRPTHLVIRDSHSGPIRQRAMSPARQAVRRGSGGGRGRGRRCPLP